MHIAQQTISLHTVYTHDIHIPLSVFEISIKMFLGQQMTIIGFFGVISL